MPRQFTRFYSHLSRKSDTLDFAKMKLLSDIIGLPIITKQSGETIAVAVGLVFHPDTGQLLALEARDSFFGASLYLTPYDLLEWRRTRIFVRDEAPLLEKGELPRLAEVLDLEASVFGARVETERGEYCGKVVNLSFDPVVGQLLQIFVEKQVLFWSYGQKRIFDFTSILSVTSEKILVSESSGMKKGRVLVALETA